MQCVSDVLGLKGFQGKQFFRGSRCKLFIKLYAEGRHPVPGLAGNSHADAAFADDLADFLQKNGGAVQIYFQNGFYGGLARRNARRINEHGNLPVLLRSVYQRKD